jgi:hypothetical protein
MSPHFTARGRRERRHVGCVRVHARSNAFPMRLAVDRARARMDDDARASNRVGRVDISIERDRGEEAIETRGVRGHAW